MITFVALPFQVKELTGSFWAVGLIGVVEIIPLIVFGLYGGVLADYLDRKKMIWFTEFGTLIATSILLINSLQEKPSVILIFVIAAIFAALSGLKRPSQDAILPRLVNHDDLPSASALMSLRWQFGGIVGPSVGGIIIASYGAGAAYFIDCLTFVISLALIWQVRSVPPLDKSTPPSMAGLMEGLNYAFKRKDLLGTYVVDFEIRHWNNLDQSYWLGFKIGSRMLNRYNVSPLKFFTMEKIEDDGHSRSFLFDNNFTYGYFKDDGTLYKIYCPKNTDKKFIKVNNYIQGLDQLKSDCEYLIITSSLKDLMCFHTLGIGNIEVIAPDSENSMIKESDIEMLKSCYKKIITLFDNDEAGIASMKKYKKIYNLDYVILDMEKDLSDSVKVHGIDAVRDVLFPLLRQTL